MLGLGTAVVHPVADKMADGMWVDSFEEILCERCCEVHKMSHLKRNNGPGAAYDQEFFVWLLSRRRRCRG